MVGRKFVYKGEETDQMDYVLKQLKENPYSRRIMTNLYPVSYTHLDVYKRQGHGTVLGVADKVIGAVKAGKISHFFLVGGCDGARTRCV